MTPITRCIANISTAPSRSRSPCCWADAEAGRLMAELALRHHQVVLLVMRSLHHDSHEAERPELCHLPGVAAGDGHLDAARQVVRFGVPAELDKLVHMRRKHALDRVARAAFSGHRDFNAVVEAALG